MCYDLLFLQKCIIHNLVFEVVKQIVDICGFFLFQVFYLPFHDDLRNLPEVNFVSTDSDELQLAKQVIK